MSKFQIMRTDAPFPDDKGPIRDFLFGMFDGLGDAARKAWRRLWSRLIKLSPGELAQVEITIPRNPKFHRKFFALLNLGFDAWEPPCNMFYDELLVTKNFEQFREDITIAAGYYEVTHDLHGNLKLRAKSISFSNMDDTEFEKVYSAVADVLLRDVLKTYAGRAELDDVVNKVMGFL